MLKMGLKSVESVRGMSWMLMDFMDIIPNPLKLVGAETMHELPSRLRQHGGTMGTELGKLMEDLFLAVPKSKISYSKKRIKNNRLNAKQINWIRCERCGEPKIPGKICEENKDVCALRDAEFASFLKAQLSMMNNSNTDK